MFKFFKMIKERWSCEHDYKVVKANKVNYVPEAIPPFIYYTHEVKCAKCGKGKYRVSSKWVDANVSDYFKFGAGKDDFGVIRKPNLSTARDNTRTRKYPIGKPIDDEVKE
jgi:hypothetical protein